MNISLLKLALVTALLSSARIACAQFTGGESQGHSNIRLSNISCSVSNVNPFAGGEADGHSNNRLTNVTCAVTNINPFSGGEADGHSNERLTNVTCSVINVNPFGGGLADGHSNERLTNVTCVVINVNPYIGGEADGHSNVNLTNNPLCLPLPIELLSFQAFVQEEEVQLKWSTNTEINNDYFTVERSKDGVTFEKVADVKGAGNSNTILHYALTDNTPLQGKSYYRLKQTDFSGQFDYSSIIAVNLDNPFSEYIHVYPNPFINEVTFELLGNSNPVEFEILNPLGMVVYKGSLDGTTTTIPTQFFSSGMYVIKFSDGIHVETKTTIKE